MAQVAVSINGRRYEIGCDDGQEDRLRLLAAAVDRRVRKLEAAVGQIGEARLLLLTCLLLEDELSEAGSTGGGADGAGELEIPEPAVAEENLDELVRRIEAVALRLKQT